MAVREGCAAAVRGNIAAAHREQSQLLRRRRLDRGRLHVARAWAGAPRRVRRALWRRREGGRARTGKLSGTQLFVHGGACVGLERANELTSAPPAPATRSPPCSFGITNKKLHLP